MEQKSFTDHFDALMPVPQEATPLKSSEMTLPVLINPLHLENKSIDLKEMLKEIELLYIRKALDCSDGIVAHAAQKLGLRRTTLVEKIKKYNISK